MKIEKTAKFRRLLGFLLISGALLYAASVGIVLWNDATSAISEPFVFKIEQGASVAQIEEQLLEARILSRPWRWLFRLWGRLKGYDRRLKVGEARIPYGAGIATLWEELKSSTKSTLTLRFVEGWTLRDIREYLKNQKVPGDLYEVTGAPLAPDSQEGFLFPDTYEFYADATVADVAKKMRDNFERKVEPLLPRISARGATLKEALTMASLLEAEVKGAVDRRLVADILWRRLDNRWPLQIDSTINYITGKKKPSVSSRETEIDSLYNTYKYKGLPPGPINNPGLGALEAALEPEANDYWFFLTTPQGEIKYGRTLEEHKANRRFLH